VAGSKSIFFLISGGVDSTVAFVLCAKALSKERVLGLYVDTGFMREGETGELRRNLDSLGLGERLNIWDASNDFWGALKGKTDPEEKRQIIGRLFVDIQSKAMQKFGIDSEGWLLGQGTIYPDTIESGGSSGRAALIKTHHNRCEEIRELLRQGRVIEPLAEFYKDEVRSIGLELGLSGHLTNRWPFPGPGLAIRCICTSSLAEKATVLPHKIVTTLDDSGYRGVLIPLQSVGVQGDSRTYRKVVAIEEKNGRVDYPGLRKLSSWLCNEHTESNRVILLVAGKHSVHEARVSPRGMDPNRVETLRRADLIARSEIETAGLTDSIWQFPVVLAPISFADGESIVLRPVNSEDGMTANFAEVAREILQRIGERIVKLPGVDAVFLDVTNKPPATIEWE
jgi:GMP synthase (glutamine-hydrolysing)